MSLNVLFYIDCIMNIMYGISICKFYSFFFGKKNVVVKFLKFNVISFNYLLIIFLVIFLFLKNIVNKKLINML